MLQTNLILNEKEDLFMKRASILVGLLFVFSSFIPTLTSAQGKLTYGLSISTLGNAAYVTLTDGVRAEAKKQDIPLTVLNADNKLEKQIKDVEDMIEKKIDVLFINPCHANAAAVIEKAVKSGMKAITLQRAVDSPFVSSHIGTDNVVLGKQAGQWLVDKLGGKGNVVVLEGVLGAESSEDRKKGSSQIFAKYPGIKIVAQQTGKYDRAVALGVMENILQAQPKVDAIFCYNDEMAMGALAAVRAAKRTDIIITGFDAIKDAVAAIEKGDITMTLALPMFDMGRLAATYGKWLKTGEMTVPLISIMPVKVVTR